MRVLLWFLALVGFAVVPSFAFAVDYSWTGSRTSPGSVYFRGPNGLPFDIDRGRYVGIASEASGGATLTGSFTARIGTSLVPVSGSRVVAASSLARIAAAAAKFNGPMILAGLAYEGYMVWSQSNGRFEVMTGGSVPSTIGQQVPYDETGWCGIGGHSATCGDALTVGTIAKDAAGWSAYSVSGIKFVQPSNGELARASVYCGQYECAFIRRVTVVPPSSIPATDMQIENAIYGELVSKGMGAELARRLVDAGYETSVTGSAGPLVVSGPSSVPGSSTTSNSTGPAGQTNSTRDTTYNFSYEGDVITVTTTNTTTTINPDATQTVSTETESGGGGDAAEAPSKGQGLCDLYPDASGCQELGDPEDEELEEQERDISFAQEGYAAGSCPAPKPFTIQGHSFELTWQPVCDFASGIRPFVIGIASIGAAIFVFGVASRKS